MPARGKTGGIRAPKIDTKKHYWLVVLTI
jgi:hypothetical protein